MAADATIKGIEFQVIGEAKSAQSSLDALSNTLKRLKRVLGGGLGMTALVKNLEKLGTVSNNINVDNIKKLASAMNSLGKVKLDPSVAKSVKELSDAFKQFKGADMENVSKAMSSLAKLKGFGNDNFKSGMAALVYGLQQIQKMDLSNLEKAGAAAKDLADAFRQGQNKKFDGSGKTEPPKPGAEAAKDYPNAFDIILQAAKQKIPQVIALFQKLGSAMGSAVKGIGKTLSLPFARGIGQVKSYAKSLGGVLGGFKRIVGYRIIRSIIREITQGFGEGIKNLYGWSNMVGGKFAASMDQIATSLTYMKNSFAAAAAPIVNALAPAIDFLIDKIVALLNLINQLFAKLSGATSWTRAIKKAQDYGDAVGGAGAAAKEALKYLAPFDELNRLPDDRSGGGGGGGGEDYSGMFEDVSEFNEGIANFADMIREKVQAGDWQGLGETLGNKVNEIIDNIDFAGLGAKVGTAINALFTTRYWTLETINFTNIGSKIAQFLNNALENIDFDIIGRSLTQGFTNLGDLIIGAVQEINWTQVGKSIGDIIRGAFNQMSDWLSSVDWEELGRNIPVYIANAIQGLDVGTLANSIWNLLKGACEAAIGLLSGLGQWLFGGGALEIKMSLTNTIGSIGSWIKSEIIDPIVGKFNEFIANHPTIAKLLGFPGASGGGGTTIDASEFSGITGTLSIDAEANLTTVKDNVPLAQKFIDKVKGIFGSTDKGAGLSAADKTIDAQANLNSYVQNYKPGYQTTASGSPKINTQANLNSYVNAFGSKYQTTASGAPKLNTQANLNSYIRAFGSGYQTTASGAPKLNSQANLTSYLQDYGSGYQTTAKGSPKINSQANFNSRDSSNLDTTFRSLASFYKGWWDNRYDDPTLEAYAKMKDPYWRDGTPTMTVYAAMEYVNNPGYTVSGIRSAKGGAYYGGAWHDIPQFASGGSLRHGSLMIAGESGAEVVGHIGGRTEVLNRSQLAATMYSAVRSAMSGIAFNFHAPSMATGSTEDGASEDMLYRAFLRALNDSDNEVEVNLDGNVIYKSVVNKNRMERQRTGMNPMLSY